MARPAFRAFALTAAMITLGACAHDEEFAFAEDSMRPAACSPRPDGGPAAGSAVPGFGCATEAILRAMVADPRDLDGGREMSAPAGDAAMAAVRRYRAGEVKPPVPVTSDAVELTVRGEK